MPKICNGNGEEECLTDEHIVRLSERISSEGEVRNLGLKVLKLSQPDIQSALTNNPKDIQSAAYEVLQKWFRQKESGQQTLSSLVESLRENEMNSLVTELPISNYRPLPPSPKVLVSGFPSVDANGISESAIMKKLKNGYHFITGQARLIRTWLIRSST